MKKILALMTVAVILLTVGGGVAFASDVSAAEYLTQYIVSNEGDAVATDERVLLDIDTQDTIDAGLLGANATDAALRTSGGVDIAFEPSVNQTYQWCAHIESVVSGGQTPLYLYSKGATGGKYRHFGGLVVNDDSSIEPGEDFALTLGGVFTKETGTYAAKEEALSLTYDSDTENVTVGIFDDWAQTGDYHIPESATGWADNNAYSCDNNTGTFADDNGTAPAGEWTPYLTLTLSESINTGSIYLYQSWGSADEAGTVDIDVYNGAWNDAKAGNIGTDTEVVITLDDTYLDVSQIRIRYQNNFETHTLYFQVNELWVREAEATFTTSVTATSVDQDEHDIEIRKNTEVSKIASHDTGDDGGGLTYVRGAEWVAQSFTLSSDNIIGGVSIKGIKLNSPGDMTIGVRASSSLTEDDLVFATIVEADLPAGSADWTVTANFSSGLAIQSGVSYAIVARCPSGSGTDRFNWNGDSSSGYSDGQRCYSSDSGNSWGCSSSIDMMFRIYSNDGLQIWIDEEPKSASVSGEGLSISDTANDWIFGGYLYINDITITVNGEDAGRWQYEYAEEWTDLTGNGNTGYPSFPSSGTNEDLTVALLSQASTAEADVPSTVSGEGFTLIKEVPGEPSELYTEGGTDYPGGAELEEVADDTGVPYMVWAVLLAYGTSIAGGAWTYGATQKRKAGRNGSLFAMWLVSTVILVIWVIGGGRVVPGWTLIPYGFWMLGLMVWVNPFRIAAG